LSRNPWQPARSLNTARGAGSGVKVNLRVHHAFTAHRHELVPRVSSDQF
jgi:hypothetical protein